MIPTITVDEYGTKHWYLNGQRHRTDGPAIEYVDGTKYWYLNGQLHRTDGPALEYEDGTKYWYLNGQLHRTDGPAIESADGTKYWYWQGTEIDQLTHLVLSYQSTLPLDTIHEDSIICSYQQGTAMNKRIKELAVQSNLHVALLLHHYNTVDALTNSEQQELDKLKKFAELIIRECAHVIDKVYETAEPNHGCMDWATFAQSDDILEHFSIK